MWYVCVCHELGEICSLPCPTSYIGPIVIEIRYRDGMFFLRTGPWNMVGHSYYCKRATPLLIIQKEVDVNVMKTTSGGFTKLGNSFCGVAAAVKK